MFIVALFTMAIGGNNSNFHQLKNGPSVVYPSNKILFSNKKRKELLIHAKHQ